MNQGTGSGRRQRIGLALGSGSARGWAHIGAIRALEESGIRPDLVCGSSIGAVVGAAYAAGELERLEQWALGLRKRDVAALMDVRPGSGVLKGERLLAFFRKNFEDRPIEELDVRFAATATTLHTGAEVWLRDGSTLDAVWASIALPGLLPPVMRDETLLVDGGLVNPVPVSLARAMGADIVIAVDLNSDYMGRWRKKQTSDRALPNASAIDVVLSSITIMQVRITRSRMAGEPPDITIAPRLGHFSLLDFQKAEQAIAEGRRAVSRASEGLVLLDQAG